MITIRSAVYVASAVSPQGYPEDTLPEIAFAGRSNVGKSSLINCLVNRKKLVHTSRTPGRTQTINFFRINDAFFFVDLPGYGYAKVPRKIREQWGPMVENYLTGRPNLIGVFHIMDFRHPPTPDDLLLWNWLQSRQIRTVAVLTKADKVKKRERKRRLEGAAAALGVPATQLTIFSAVTRENRDELWSLIQQWIGCNDSTPPSVPPS